MLPYVILAYAIYDSEHSGRLGEDPMAQEEYFNRAITLLHMIQLRPDTECKVLADAICEHCIDKKRK